jgi:hypothetical protein
MGCKCKEIARVFMVSLARVLESLKSGFSAVKSIVNKMISHLVYTWKSVP